jgi:hypothetical protein
MHEWTELDDVRNFDNKRPIIPFVQSVWGAHFMVSTGHFLLYAFSKWA